MTYIIFSIVTSIMKEVLNGTERFEWLTIAVLNSSNLNSSISSHDCVYAGGQIF